MTWLSEPLKFVIVWFGVCFAGHFSGVFRDLFRFVMDNSRGHCPYLSCVTCDNGLQLILAVKEHPELYDFNHLGYFDVFLKEKFWDAVGQKLNSTGEECRNAWATLSAAYYTAAVERKERAKSGNAEGLPLIKWKFEDEMSFLDVYLNQDEDSSDSKKENDKNDENPEQEPPKEKTSLELFFESMREAVRTFSAENQIIAKTQIFAVVSDLELRELDVKEIAELLN